MIQLAVVSAIASILEGDEAGEGALVDPVCEGPLGAAVLLPLPVDEPAADGMGGVGGELDSTRVEIKAELPGGLDEEGEAVLVVPLWDVPVRSLQDSATESFNVLDVV